MSPVARGNGSPPEPTPHDASYEKRQKILQTARDRTLEHERTLKQLHALRRPIAALVRAAEDPALVSESSPVVASVLGELLEQFPHPRVGAAKTR